MFDQLLVLADGQTVYYGAAAKALVHMSRLGFACPRGYSTGDFLLGSWILCFIFIVSGLAYPESFLAYSPDSNSPALILRL